jgi:cytochrome oxidase Cu insertion factor (SCO1/SenC/PrrC family)
MPALPAGRTSRRIREPGGRLGIGEGEEALDMTGMGNAALSSTGLAGPFYHRLALEAIALVLLGLVLLAARYFLFAGGTSGARVQVAGSAEDMGAALATEPRGRALLRWGFGLLWILDGMLQMQRAMPTSLISQVIQPAAQGSPQWMVAVVNAAADAWNRHPVWAATGAVWIQLAIGLWLLLGKSGWFARVGYAAAVGWGLVVWVTGEAMGGILAPGASWLFGAPGAVVLYVVAAVALFFPYRSWDDAWLPRRLLALIGAELVLFGVLEAWPGRGFYHDQIASMIRTMAQTPQPSFLARPMLAVASALHGTTAALVNGLVAAVLLVVGLAFIARRFVWPAFWVLAALSLVTWWFVQDFGFLGGVGTDPNSMIPGLLLSGAAIVGLGAAGARSVATHAEESARLWPSELGIAGRLFGTWTVAVALMGLGPLAYTAIDQTTSPSLALAASDTPFAISRPTPPFTLLDQYGAPVSLSQFAGKRIVLTNLDPVCTLDCPLIAQELRTADLALPPSVRANTVFVAVAANPEIHSVASVRLFDERENLSGLSNWYFLTSPSLAKLAAVWQELGFGVTQPVDGVMVEHEEIGYVIGPHLTERFVVPMDPSQNASVAASISALYDRLVQEV